MPNLKIKAKLENIEKVIAFIDGELEKIDCPMKVQMQIDVACDEILANIVNYAYKDKDGDMDVIFSVKEDQQEISIAFVDSGVAFNPLEKEDPDVTLKAEERQIGGLGIFLVKKTMDDVIYEFKDNQNQLTILKKI